ncbi:MAG TPA: CoA pyrophosphatase [Myxococcota bacterium]|nr:CoA pyrophosphatase [Myxococcota bacterium]
MPGNLAHSRLDHALRAHLCSNLAAFRRRAGAVRGLRPAAVAIVLVPDETGRAAFLLTRRASRLRSHGGQWALPGGRLDQGEGHEAAALRELREELGLSLEPASVLGLLDDYPTRSGFVITPVVVWGEGAGDPCPNPREVASVHRVSVAELARPDVPQLRSIPESDRPVISIPLLGTQIHAPTAALLYQLVEVVFRGRDTRVAHFEQPVFAWR